MSYLGGLLIHCAIAINLALMAYLVIDDALEEIRRDR